MFPDAKRFRKSFKKQERSCAVRNAKPACLRLHRAILRRRSLRPNSLPARVDNALNLVSGDRMPALELGLDTFGDITAEPDGRALSHAQVIRNVVDEAILADDVGIDFIGLGEHHRADFAISSPEVVLAAVAARTKRIHLGSAVTVLSSDDPIRVFQRFSTLDAISNGRAEVILGRGSFIEILSAVRLRSRPIRGVL